jgi:WD40 repeat protein
MQKSPFKFLDSYTKDDRNIFFGRDREIEELYQRVFESKLMLVYGVSGTGKSSLIHCGLANKFQETDWLPLVIRRGGNIIESTASGIKAASITPQDGQFVTPLNFKKAVRSLYLDYYKPVFLIFDQFEELFIFGDKEERKSFVHIIKSLIESDIQCRVIFVMREEYMAYLTEFERYLPTIFTNKVRVEKMSHINALSAVKEPCKIFNIGLEEGFAETLLEKLSPGGIEVELTFLQVFLDKVYRMTQSGKSHETDQQQIAFTLELLQKTGDVSDLLGNFLDDQISIMDNPDLAITVLKAFVSGKGTKRPADEAETIENVHSLGKDISPDSVTEFLQTFVRLRVLRDKDENGRYELRHDALAEKIFEKFSLAEKELMEIRQLIENGYQYWLKRKILLSNDDLAYISNKDSMLNLTADLHGFLEDSRKLQKAKIKTVRRLTIISATVFLVMLAIIGYYAMNKISEIQANYLAIKSIDQTPNPVEALDLAGLAWKKNPSILSKEALLKSFNGLLTFPEKDSLMKTITDQFDIQFDPAPVNIQFAACSKDDKYIYGYGDSLIFIWNIKGKLEKKIITEHFPIIDLKISDDCLYAGAVSSDSLLTVWNFMGNIQFSCKIQYNELNTKQIFKFTNENKIISLAKGHDAVLMDLNGKVLQEFDKHSGRVNGLDISENNNFIATASSDKSINIWYLNNVKNNYTFYNNLNWHKDTVWSISFSHIGFTVISTSADSTTKIGNINNGQYFTFSGKYPFCYAEFTPADVGLVTTDYLRIKNKVKKTYSCLSYKNPKIEISNKYVLTKESQDEGMHGSSGFSYLTFSREDNNYICGEKDKYFLIDNRLTFKFDNSANLTLLDLEGSKPFFTTDGKYILTITGKKFRTYFIDQNAIYNKTFKE